jgi:hypothetical protein
VFGDEADIHLMISSDCDRKLVVHQLSWLEDLVLQLGPRLRVFPRGILLGDNESIAVVTPDRHPLKKSISFALSDVISRPQIRLPAGVPQNLLTPDRTQF